MKKHQNKSNEILSAVESVAQQIRELISNRGFSFGKKLPPERKLAEQFNVSRATVQKALDILQGQRFVKRYQGRGTFVADPTKIQKDPSKPMVLGAMTFEREYYFEPVLQAASRYAAEHGYVLAIANNSNPKDELNHINSFINNGVKGVFITPRMHTDPSVYQSLAETSEIVFIDNLHHDFTADSILVDNTAGIYQASEHFIKLGHRQIAYIDHQTDLDFPIKNHRKQGYLNACTKYNLKPKILSCDENELTNIKRQLLNNSSPPTAFVCYNDAWAARVIDIAIDLGLSIPQKLAVTGFDNSGLSQLGKIPITTINPEPHEMGILAIQRLIEKIENQRPRPILSTYITPKLIIRDSTVKLS